ncbi:hypothetical protein [Nocardia rosealba]|uniref:hypothetical protein n=1 Tax=Nocardia rosealba TaxID=2878563 RepID=UPI001CD92323|nr:hypothetical protein [Nocardia rosealba]MCA2210135.1 hypothetical protein [Nocardia rosealba]
MSQDHATHWRNLKTQAMNGEFKLEEDLGQALADVVSQYISDLEAQKFEAGTLSHLSGWGSLPSAEAIRGKYENKAVAGGSHDPDDSAVKRLDQHIAIARDQRDTFLAAIGKLQAVDQQSAGAIGNAGAGI